MGADSLAENTPNAPDLPNLFAQPQKLWISIKKGFIGRPYSVIMFMHKKIAAVEFKDQLMSKGIK